jgi:hypothetical protein
VEKVLPEVVFTNPLDGYKGVRYDEIVALLIEAIKEQQSMIERQQEENEQLNARLTRIKELLGRQ